MENQTRTEFERNYKDTVFVTVFHEKEKLIELYNAIFDTDYDKDTAIDIVTIKDVLFRTLKNDVSFVLDKRFVVLVEHQSSINGNLPLRDLLYMSTVLKRMIDTKQLYREKTVRIPRPAFIVLYNGPEDLPEYQELRDFSPLKGFKYIKTFTPLRRPTTSTGACVRFMQRQIDEWKPGQEPLTIPDELTERVLNRNYMVDWQDRLFQDSVLVRFEDCKLNPKATFTALAAFLDLPYTKSMTYCSRNGERDPESLKGNDRGFDPAAIYRTYEEYLGREERVYLEYLMGDVDRRYGDDFQYYDGAPMDEEAMNALVGRLHGCTDLILASYKKAMEHKVFFEGEDPEQRRQEILTEIGENMAAKRREIAGVLMRGLRFVNKNGAPLNFMPLLELDPALLEQPLYH